MEEYTEPSYRKASVRPMAFRSILFYLYAEPHLLPNSNKPIDDEAKAVHRDEIKHFEKSVEGDEVRFVACTYRDMLATWERSESPEVREHAKAVACHFSP